jgi:spermidine synthase
MRVVAICCFFLSGASGLIFEVIWTRMFSLVFGATTLAISAVLTAFMGGLALGSYVAGRIADRIRDPLRAYALAEAGVGACALALPLVVGAFGSLNQFLYAHFQDNYTLLTTSRFLASAVVMVVPTTLMGATLPLLSRFFVQTRDEHTRVGLRVGTLYAVNTFGAVLGTFLGGFVLLPVLGLTLTNRLAAGANIALALVVGCAYLIRRRLPAPTPQDPEVAALLNEVRAPAPVADVPRRARLAVLIAFAFSGAVAMVYQVMWSRALSMNIGSSVYSFTIVLVAFLIGLASGAALLSRLAARTRNPTGWLAINHLVVVVFAGLAYLVMDKLPFIFLYLIKGRTLDASVVLTAQFALSLVVMLPATFAMGGILPLTIRVYASGLERVGQDVGNAYSINTIGAIAGSAVAGFVVIPVLQLQPGHLLAVSVNLLIALVLTWLAPWRLPQRIVATAVALALAGGALFLPRWNLNHVSAGLFRLSIARDVLKTGRWEDPKLVYYRDGISTTVSVEQWSREHFSLKNNGKVDASTGDDMPTQITVGLLPILLHPRVPAITPRVALIGYASGVTAGAVLQYPVAHLDVIELEPAIKAASRFFEHINHRPLADKRMRWISDDGRNFLQAGKDTYDVIINEPSNPWITGVANLFTREYFETGRRRLAEDGVFCTWAQMYEISPRRVKSIYRTFASVFPYTYAFSAEALSSDTFLIGTNKPLQLDLQRLRAAYAIPSVLAEMKRAKVPTPEGIVALTLLGPSEIHAYSIGAEMNTDDNALVEFGAPTDMYNHKQYDYYVSKVYGHKWLYGRLGGFVTGLRRSEDHAALVRALLVTGKFREATLFHRQVRPDAGPRSLHAQRLIELLSQRDVLDEEIPITDEGPPLTPPLAPKVPGKPEVQQQVAREYFLVEQRAKVHAWRSALDLIEGWPEAYREEAGEDFQLLWGFLVYKAQDFHAAVNTLEALWEDKAFLRKRPAALYYLGRAWYGNADYEKAIAALEAWIRHREKSGKAIAPPPMPDDDRSGEMLDVRP